GLRLRIVPLFPSKDDRELFSRLLGHNALVDWKELRGAVGVNARVSSSGTVPTGLVVAAVLVVLLLALNELRCVRLPLPGRSRAGPAPRPRARGRWQTGRPSSAGRSASTSRTRTPRRTSSSCFACGATANGRRERSGRARSMQLVRDSATAEAATSADRV